MGAAETSCLLTNQEKWGNISIHLVACFMYLIKLRPIFTLPFGLLWSPPTPKGNIWLLSS